MNPTFRRILLGGGSVAPSYLYSDPANPTFTTIYGYGNKSDGRADLRPIQKRILVDGTTSHATGSNYWHEASLSAAFSRAAAGDWVLLPGGQTSTTAVINPTGFIGASNGAVTAAQNMAVLGTFDPADAENDAKFNTLMHTIDPGTSGTVCSLNYVATDLAVCNLIWKMSEANRGGSSVTMYQPGVQRILFENCVQDGCSMSIFIGGEPVPTPPCATAADSEFLLDITLRFFGSLYTNGSGSTYGNSSVGLFGNIRRLRFEAPVFHHSGWSKSMTRATTLANGGPSPYKHHLYVGQSCHLVSIMECVGIMGSSNHKFTGGPFEVQNLVSIYDGQPYRFGPRGNDLQTGALRQWPTGAVMRDSNFLEIGCDDIAYDTPRGHGPSLLGSAPGSFVRDALLVDDPAHRVSIQGIECNANGELYATAMLMDRCVLNGWNGQTVTNDDAYTTLTFTNNVWPRASQAGGNTTITSTSAGYQAGLTASKNRKFHTSFRTAHPEYFSGIDLGANDGTDASNMAIVQLMGEVMARNPLVRWSALLNTHWRSVMLPIGG